MIIRLRRTALALFQVFTPLESSKIHRPSSYYKCEDPSTPALQSIVTNRYGEEFLTLRHWARKEQSITHKRFAGFCVCFFFLKNMPAQFFKKPLLFLRPGLLNSRSGKTQKHQPKEPMKASDLEGLFRFILLLAAM